MPSPPLPALVEGHNQWTDRGIVATLICVLCMHHTLLLLHGSLCLDHQCPLLFQRLCRCGLLPAQRCMCMLSSTQLGSQRSLGFLGLLEPVDQKIGFASPSVHTQHAQLFELLDASQCLVPLLDTGSHGVELSTGGIKVLLQLLHLGGQCGDFVQGRRPGLLLLSQAVMQRRKWSHKAGCRFMTFRTVA